MFGVRGEQLKHRARRVDERQSDASDAQHADASVRQALAEEKALAPLSPEGTAGSARDD